MTKRDQFRHWLLHNSLESADIDEVADAAAEIWERHRTLEHCYCGNCGSRMRPGTTTECSNDSCIRNAWIKEENEAAEAIKEKR